VVSIPVSYFGVLDSNISSETSNSEIFGCIFQPHQANIRILKSEVLTAVSMKNKYNYLGSDTMYSGAYQGGT
jgi:hypothetical protein